MQSEEEEEEEPPIYIDGFLIESVREEEEPLFVSRDEEVVMPDYSGASAKCCICSRSYHDILDSVRSATFTGITGSSGALGSS